MTNYAKLTEIATKLLRSGNDPVTPWGHFSQADRVLAAAAFERMVEVSEYAETLHRTGIVSPAYDPDETHEWQYGITADRGSTNTPATSYLWDTSANEGYMGAFEEWDVTPGSRTITWYSIRGAYLRDGHENKAWVTVWREDASTYTMIGSCEIPLQSGTTGTETWQFTLPTPITVNIETGKKYFVGMLFWRKTTVSTNPYLARTNGEAFQHTNILARVQQAKWNGSTLPKVSETGITIDIGTEAILQHFRYTSGNYIEQEFTPVTDKSYLLARQHIDATYTVGPFAWKMQSVAVADGAFLQMELRDFAGDCSALAMETIRLDCGATTPGTNTLTCHGNATTLGTINSKAQVGCGWDLLFDMRPRYGNSWQWELFSCNRSLECKHHAHATKTADARGTKYAHALSSYPRPASIKFTGTFTWKTTGATGGKFQVAVHPMVIVGDSQTNSGYTSGGTDYYRQPNLSRWGGLFDELTKKRMYVTAGQAGHYFGDIGGSPYGVESSLLNNATPGEGDLIELLGLGSVWYIAGIGVNDISALTSGDADMSGKDRAAWLVKTLSSLVHHMFMYGEQVWIGGLPPYSTAGSADANEARGIRCYNRALIGLALAWQCPYYNPWVDLVQVGTEDDDVPQYNPIYTDDDGQGDPGDDGLHLSTAGGTVVKAGMKYCVETEGGTVDTRDAWD